MNTEEIPGELNYAEREDGIQGDNIHYFSKEKHRIGSSDKKRRFKVDPVTATSSLIRIGSTKALFFRRIWKNSNLNGLNRECPTMMLFGTPIAMY